MKASLLHLFLTLSLLCLAAAAFGQGKVYTRKVRLADFPDKTTWIVLPGESHLELVLRDAVTDRWTRSPYDFCTPEDYDQLSRSNDNYLLRLARDESFTYLVLSKGGEEMEANNLKAPFEVVRLPVASAGDPDGRELLYMEAFLEIIQAFVEDAMQSDKTAYRGLAAVGGGSLDGKTVYLDPVLAETHFRQGEADVLAAVIVTPVTAGGGAHCYKMLISADTHQLYSFEKARYRTPADAAFTDAEAERLAKRHATVIR